MPRRRFTCARLSHSYLTRSMPRLLTMTFTTAVFSRSSSWRFEAFPCRTAPKGPPSSLVQHDALERLLDTMFPVVSTIRPPDPIPLLQPHYRAFIAFTDRSASVLRIGTLASRFFAACASPLSSEHWSPAVPRKSLHPVHAPSTPVTVRPVNQAPDRLFPVEVLASF